jgi:uncharacterized protein DUF5719
MAELGGIRVRAVALVVVAAFLAGSGLLLDRVVGPEGQALGAPSAGPSGAMFCPHGGHSGWQGWVVVTNPGQRRVRVRLTQMGKEGTGSVSTFSVGALRHVYRQVSADDPADATEVEYFGGWVGVAAILSTGAPGGLAAERCEQSAHRNWFVMDVPTGSDQISFLVVMNPFDESAEFDVVLRTEQREVSSGSLTPFVLAPRHSVGILVNDFLLLGTAEQSLTARVTQRMGRVVAGGLQLSPAGIRAETGVPASGTQWVIPAGADAGSRQLVVLNSGDSRVDFSVVAEGSAAQRLVSGPEGLSVGPDQVKTFQLERVKGAGLVVAASNGRPMVATLRLTGPRGDSATLDGSSTTAGRWLVLPALPPSGGRSFLLLQNPGRSKVEVSVRLIGTGGPIPSSIRQRSILPGRTIRIIVPSQGDLPVSALVTTRGGTIAAAVASYLLDRAGYAATLGVPIR